MALPGSGQISIQDIRNEFNGGGGATSLAEYYVGQNNVTWNNQWRVPSSGQIAMSQFYNTSRVYPGSWDSGTPGTYGLSLPPCQGMRFRVWGGGGSGSTASLGGTDGTVSYINGYLQGNGGTLVPAVSYGVGSGGGAYGGNSENISGSNGNSTNGYGGGSPYGGGGGSVGVAGGWPGGGGGKGYGVLGNNGGGGGGGFSHSEFGARQEYLGVTAIVGSGGNGAADIGAAGASGRVLIEWW